MTHSNPSEEKEIVRTHTVTPAAAQHRVTRADRLGATTSEWKLALITYVVGVALVVVGAAAPGSPLALGTERMREVFLGAGALLLTGSSAGYSVARAKVKAALAAAQAVVTVEGIKSQARGRARNAGRK